MLEGLMGRGESLDNRSGIQRGDDTPPRVISFDAPDPIVRPHRIPNPVNATPPASIVAMFPLVGSAPPMPPENPEPRPIGLPGGLSNEVWMLIAGGVALLLLGKK